MKTKTKPKNPRDDYDSPWKDIIRQYFEAASKVGLKWLPGRKNSSGFSKRRLGGRSVPFLILMEFSLFSKK